MVDGQNSIILSFINDEISVPINKVMDKLFKEDYKEYKKTFVEICSCLKEFSQRVNFIIGGYEDD